jgi:plasmid stabilization system protein ParE
MTYRLSPQAELELEAIGDHIAEDSPANAQRFIERLTGKFVMWAATLTLAAPDPSCARICARSRMAAT